MPFITQLLSTVALQIAGLFGIFFVFGFILSKLQEWTQTEYMNSVGWRGILWTAWIGTPIHEAGHAIMAKLFRHRIERFAIFAPNRNSGELGAVDHSFNPRSLYQRLGNFFIGAAPMIFGSLALFLLVRYLLPNGPSVLLPLVGITANSNLQEIPLHVFATLGQLFSFANIHSWSFYLFLYVSFAVASHLAPSKLDRGQIWGGFFWILLILIAANAVAMLVHRDITSYVLYINKYLAIFTVIFLYATIISLLHWCLIKVVLAPFKRN